MKHLYGNYLKSFYLERARLYLMEVKTRDSGVWMIAETIVYSCAQVMGRLMVGEDGKVMFCAEWADIVYAANMVVVLVGKQYRVESAEPNAEGLLP